MNMKNALTAAFMAVIMIAVIIGLVTIAGSANAIAMELSAIRTELEKMPKDIGETTAGNLAGFMVMLSGIGKEDMNDPVITENMPRMDASMSMIEPLVSLPAEEPDEEGWIDVPVPSAGGTQIEG